MYYSQALAGSNVNYGKSTALKLEQSTANVTNSHFYDNQYPAHSGGAIVINEGITRILSTNFDRNKADKGAAIHYTSLSTGVSSLMVTNTNFTDNVATSSGGAIQYTYFRPVISGVKFLRNRAIYGEDLASYPTKIKVADNDATSPAYTNVVSGQEFNHTFKFILQDYDS